MALEGVIHCDADDCNHHSHVGVQTMVARRLPAGWVRVEEFGDSGTVIVHAFCNGDCALKWLAAHSSPPEIIPWDEALGTE